MRHTTLSALSLFGLLVSCSGDSPTTSTGPDTGRLLITVTGSDGPADVVIRGPARYEKAITETTTLEGLKPGAYTITASTVLQSGIRFVPEHPTLTVQVTASDTASQATVHYVEILHTLVVNVSGLPAGAGALIAIHGPGTHDTTSRATDTLSLASEGTYTISASNVVDSGKTYTAAPATSTVTVTASATALSVAFAYTLASVPFIITVSGLPNTVPATISVTGPAGFPQQTLTASATLWPYLTGSYAVTAAGVQVSNRTFIPTPATATLTLTGPGAPLTLHIAYADAKVARLSVIPATMTAEINIGGALFVANELDALGNPLQDSVTWTSSDNAVATVGPTGSVTAKSPGVTTVTASVDGMSATALVTVPVPVIEMVAGKWSFSMTADLPTIGFGRCRDSGELDIVQAVGASSFTATGTQSGSCTFNFAVVSTFPKQISVAGSTLNAINFHLGPCSVSASPDHTGPDHLVGTVSCKVDRPSSTRSIHFVATGIWSAQRIP